MSHVVTAVLYYRVSTDEQGRKGFSLPEQHRECIARAQTLATQQHARLEFFEFEDTASGEILERPGLEACREFIRNKHSEAQYFVCLDPDRFARSLFLQLLVTEEIEKAGLQLVFVQHDYKNSAEGRLFYQMRGAISEFEKAKIKERTARGRRGKLAAGQIPNKVQPWGYSWDKESKTLQINPSEAPWVQEIFRWYLDGCSYTAIAVKLTELGVPAPGGSMWYRSTIRRILENSVYVGQLVLNKWDAAGRTPLRKVPREKRRSLSARTKPQEDWVTIDVDPLIPADVWVRVRDLHKNRTRLSQRGVGLLSGLCICGLCGSHIHYAGEKNRRYLRCIGRYPHHRDGGVRLKARPACELRNVRADRFEAEIWEQVKAWVRDPAELQKAYEAQNSTRESNQVDEQRVALLQKELAERQEEHRRMFRLAVKGLAPAGVEEDLDRLASQVRAIESEIASLTITQESSPPPLADYIAGLQEMSEDIGRELDDLNLEGRQLALRRLIREITIYPDHTWKYRFK